jgi:hypothetical protein
VSDKPNELGRSLLKLFFDVSLKLRLSVNASLFDKSSDFVKLRVPPNPRLPINSEVTENPTVEEKSLTDSLNPPDSVILLL